MFGNTFYFALTKKYVTVFGTIFNAIQIERNYNPDPLTLEDEILTLDDENLSLNYIQTIKVPLTYASQDKMMARLFGDPTLDRQVAAVTPAMSFEVGPPRYDSERKLQTTLTRCFTNSDGDKLHQYIPVPYNLEFTLYIYAREEEDGLRILEQILPHFTPGFTVTAKLAPEMNYRVDIPIILNSVDFDNGSYGEFPDRRRLIWTLRFTMKAEFLGPVIGGGDKKLIRIVHANIRSSTTEEILEEVHVEPGLTANGDPTSVRSESIDVTLINPDDEYGYIIEINEGPTPHP